MKEKYESLSEDGLRQSVSVQQEENMKGKYESLSLSILRDLAKSRGMKGISTLKKGELVDRMLEQDELDKKAAPKDDSDAHVPESSPAARKQENDRNTYAKKSSPAAREQENDRNAYAKKSSPAAREQENDRNAYAKKSSPAAREQENDRNAYAKKSSPAMRVQENNLSSNVQRMPQQTKTQQHTHRTQDEMTAEERYRTVDDRTIQKMEAEGMSMEDLDSGERAEGILEVMQDGYGFIRSANYLPGEQDVYVSPSQIRRFRLKTGDIISGNKRLRSQGEKFSALLYINSVNGLNPSEAARRTPFEELTPIFPNERLRFETTSANTAMRIVDLIAPVGKGQRGMIVSQPKAGKTTLLKEIATSVKQNNPEMHLIILLIDERPEEVTDIKEAIGGKNVEVIYSTFDELPEHHKRVSEMVIERAKRLVEHGKDVMILLDSITRLARAYNLVVQPSGRTLSGGLDPGALHMPKRFFGAARNMREGGSLTILATALVETGSRMDDVVYEEFKGTGNMELILDRKLSERRIFPAIDIVKSGTRREDLLLSREEKDAVDCMRRALNGVKTEEVTESILRLFVRTRDNRDLVHQILTRKLF